MLSGPKKFNKVPAVIWDFCGVFRTSVFSFTTVK